MKASEFGQGYALLVSAYRSQLKEMSEEERKDQRTLYYSMLREMDPELWKAVVHAHIQSSQWFPKVSDLVELAGRLSGVLSPAEHAHRAFELAHTSVRRLDPLTHTPMSEVREDVDRVVRALGGWERFGLVETSELGWYRKEFTATWLDLYASQLGRGDLSQLALGGGEARVGPRELGDTAGGKRVLDDRR